jgi:two-component system chemotaxis response regulator CheB
MSRQVRVLVIDDSAYNRQIIADFLTSSPEFEIVGRAEDGEQGLKLAAVLKPDLITLDIEMPRMDGFTFLRLLMSQMPTPVIMVSSHSRKQEVFQALELGALDFVAKPERFLTPDLSDLRDELLRKALAVRALQVVPLARRSTRPPPPAIAEHMAQKSRPGSELENQPLVRLVAIGASTGGPPALQTILKALSPTVPTAVMVSQHMPEKFTRAFAERLDRSSAFDVHEAEQGERIVPGSAYIAPGGSHLEVAGGGRDPLTVRLTPTTPADRYVPSIDRMFTSIAKVRGPELVGVVLTGMGADGAEGIRILHAAGARTIAESEESAIVFGMPKEAIHTGAVDEILHLDDVVGRLQVLVTSA